MDIILCIPGMDLNIEDFKELDINVYHNQDNIGTKNLNYLLRFGKKKEEKLTHSQILSDYILNENFKSLILKELGLNGQTNAILISPAYSNMQLHSMHIIFSNKLLNISYKAAKIICDDLNQVYLSDGYQFYVYREDIWLMTMPYSLDYFIKPIFDLNGFVNYLEKPEGKEHKKILKLQTEISMMLFQHQINQRREEQNLLPINFVWLWNDISSNLKDDFKKSLYLGDLQWLPNYPNVVPLSFNEIDKIKQYILCNSDKQIIFYFNCLYQSLLKSDIAEHMALLKQLDQGLLGYLVHLINVGKIAQLSLVSNGNSGGVLTMKKRGGLLSNINYLFKKQISYEGSWF